MLAGVSKWAEINAPWGEDVVEVSLVCRGRAVFPCSCPGPPSCFWMGNGAPRGTAPLGNEREEGLGLPVDTQLAPGDRFS